MIRQANSAWDSSPTLDSTEGFPAETKLIPRSASGRFPDCARLNAFRCGVRRCVRNQ
jgi:hypothetical protein